jgi:hypothetical protein
MRVKLRADFRDRITDERLHKGVTPLEEYYVIEVSHVEFRVIDDGGEPILYPKALFEVIDPTLPPGWQFCEYLDGEYHLEPVRTGRAGFYEDLFCSDGDRAAQVEARRVLREVLEAAMLVSSEQDRRLIERDLRRLIGS